jgi:hypothetical protein
LAPLNVGGRCDNDGNSMKIALAHCLPCDLLSLEEPAGLVQSYHLIAFGDFGQRVFASYP